jgi:ABC-type Mn2+/Zn2+ transport system ATPase subunit
MLAATCPGLLIASGRLALEDVDLAVPCGMLAVVVGEVGAGKSSLLAGVAGELRLAGGDVAVSGSVAYVPQRPWVFTGTVR